MRKAVYEREGGKTNRHQEVVFWAALVAKGGDLVSWSLKESQVEDMDWLGKREK